MHSSEKENDRVTQAITETINSVLTDSGRSAKSYSESDRLTADIGLDSLDLAVLVVGLEQRLGVDPFRSGARAVQTYGELVSVYQRALDNAE